MNQQLYNYYANNKLAFFKDYVMIPNNKCGKMTKIEMFAGKKEILQSKNILIKKARSMGITELIAAEIAYNLNFKNNYQMIYMASTYPMAQDAKNKVIRHFSTIPDSIRIGLRSNINKNNYTTVNNNNVIFSGENSNAGISCSFNAIYFEEVDFMKDFFEAYYKIGACLTTTPLDAKILISTTPGNSRSHFETLWKDIHNRFDRVEMTYNSQSTIPKTNTLNDITKTAYAKIIREVVIA